MKKQFEDVHAAYGAPMGRRDYVVVDEARVELFRVRFVDGDYDDGGAYWGGGDPLFCARGEGVEYFIRADSWEEAKEKLLDEFPLMQVIEQFDLEAMLDAYLTCALWSSTGDDEQPLDDQYDVEDIDVFCVNEAREDCQSFVDLCRDNGVALLDAAQMGHDFWLTRNHHGAGFWDRGLGEQGLQLTKWANTFGSCDAYVGDDGKVYLS